MGHLLGVISDTHGLLRPEVIPALRGCSQIIHAGDVGRPDILDELRALAPTVAVRGNVDRKGKVHALPLRENLAVNGVNIHVLHDLQTLNQDPDEAGFRVVISGHSHQPRVETRDGVLYLNPGAAGPRRFRLPVTLARLEIRDDGSLRTDLIDLLDPQAAPDWK